MGNQTQQQSTAMTKGQPQGQQLAKDGPPDPVKTMRGFINQSQGAFAKILPKHLTIERFLKVSHAAMTKTPKLALCDPRSMIMALILCSELGLEPNTPLGYAYLIPFKRKFKDNSGRWCEVLEVQLQIGYQGYLQLARQSGQVGAVGCYIAYKNDVFDVELGDEPRIKHVPILDGEPGNIRAAYMVAKLANGQLQREVMNYAQLLKIRDRSPAVRLDRDKKGPWFTDEPEMCRKTVFRRGQKWLPRSTDKDLLARAAEIDGRMERTPGKAGPIDFSVIEELPVELRPTPEMLEEGDGDPDVIEGEGEEVSNVAPEDALKAKLKAEDGPPATETKPASVVEPTPPAAPAEAKKDEAPPADAADDGPAPRAKRRTPDEARAEEEALERELAAAIDQLSLGTVAAVEEWTKAQRAGGRWKKLSSGAKSRLNDVLYQTVTKLEADEKAAKTSTREPGSEG